MGAGDVYLKCIVTKLQPEIVYTVGHEETHRPNVSMLSEQLHKVSLPLVGVGTELLRAQLFPLGWRVWFMLTTNPYL